VLGAGFSRAISTGMAANEGMPNMVELSEAVVYNLSAKGRSEIRGFDTPLAKNFEQWLSYLIESPPWLSESDQDRNRADFLDVSLAVHEVLWERQGATVMHHSCPDWLQCLVQNWQEDRATVITFNYDLFVELAWLLYAANAGPRRNISMDLYPVPVTPIGTRMGGVLTSVGGPRAISAPPDGLKLLKLHGSLNWWYSGPKGTPGEPIYDWGIKGDSGWNLDQIGPTHADLSDVLTAGLQPMIVPPAAVKSAYYNNQTLQALWKKAAKALSEAEELVIMGFSLPRTDMLVSSMLCTEFRLTDASRIVPVDYGTAIVSRICETFDIKSDDGLLIAEYAGRGDDAIHHWVETFAN